MQAALGRAGEPGRARRGPWTSTNEPADQEKQPEPGSAPVPVAGSYRPRSPDVMGKDLYRPEGGSLADGVLRLARGHPIQDRDGGRGRRSGDRGWRDRRLGRDHRWGIGPGLAHAEPSGSGCSAPADGRTRRGSVHGGQAGHEQISQPAQAHRVGQAGGFARRRRPALVRPRSDRHRWPWPAPAGPMGLGRRVERTLATRTTGRQPVARPRRLANRRRPTPRWLADRRWLAHPRRAA